MEKALTSTSLTQKQSDALVVHVKENLNGKLKYSPDLNQEVIFLVIDSNDPKKRWLKSKKFMYVVSYRPDVTVIDYSELVEKKLNPFKLLQMKPFKNLVISLCRLEDNLMKKITIAIEENGGIVKHHLTSDTDVMISMFPEGRRYEACIEWGIHVVSPDWCYDSIDRGLPLNTYFYKLQHSVTNYVTKLNYENEEDNIGSEVVVKTYRLGKRDQACDWEKLNEWRNKESKRILEDYIKVKIDYDNKISSDVNETLINETYEELTSKRKLIEIKDEEEEEKVVVKIKKPNKSKECKGITIETFNSNNTLESNIKKKKIRKGPVLSGLKFKLKGYNPELEAKLSKIIVKFGGIVLQEGYADFTVVNFSSKCLEAETSNAITELAIERFIYNEEVDGSNYYWCKPFHLSSQITMSEFRKVFSLSPEDSDRKVKVAITAFDGTDLSHIEKVFSEKLDQWIEFQQVFNENCDILVIGPSAKITYSAHTTKKRELASKWGTLVLTIEEFSKKILELAAKN
ncbi:hypothetical protein CANINC_003134 [Pichia inconspicua]|uniref:BRCT domain-containing protein n=1 Tax=Pichia inconspicua TaxID=52247 RepID=A0A4T0WZH1_9ASCO|nr:hypothetical protein CANINC_003134 [[Candida] inconspicua]